MHSFWGLKFDMWTVTKHRIFLNYYSYDQLSSKVKENTQNHRWFPKCWTKEARHKRLHTFYVHLDDIEKQTRITYGDGFQDRGYTCSDWSRARGASGGLVMFCFFIWVLVTSVGSSREKSSSCIFIMYILLCIMSFFNKITPQKMKKNPVLYDVACVSRFWTLSLVFSNNLQIWKPMGLQAWLFPLRSKQNGSLKNNWLMHLM